MSETATDSLTKLEAAIVAHMEVSMAGAIKRVLTSDDVGADRPLPAKYLPCLVVGLGVEMPDTGERVALEGGQDDLVPSWVQVDLMVAVDSGERGFAASVRALSFRARAAISEFAATTTLAIDSLKWVGTTPHDLAS